VKSISQQLGESVQEEFFYLHFEADDQDYAVVFNIFLRQLLLIRLTFLSKLSLTTVDYFSNTFCTSFWLVTLSKLNNTGIKRTQVTTTTTTTQNI
jgi:hypothetical protein